MSDVFGFVEVGFVIFVGDFEFFVELFFVGILVEVIVIIVEIYGVCVWCLYLDGDVGGFFCGVVDIELCWVVLLEIV